VRTAVVTLATLLASACQGDRAPGGAGESGAAGVGSGALIDAERARDPEHAAIRAASDRGDPVARAEALRAIGRIGEDRALHRLVPLLDDPQARTIGWALALLDPPRDLPGAPARPTGAWARAEDALWSRYAVTEDDDLEQLAGLSLAIARLGGPRSIDRLAADLAVVPGEADAERWALAMEALGTLCARGHALTELARDAVAEGIELPRASPRQASLYAMGRCARSSAEVLAVAAERRVIVDRLAPTVATGSDEDRRLAWRALASLGEIVEPVPSEILGREAPDWKTEVEAVRALVATPAGRREARIRVQALDSSWIDSTRWHVLVEWLRGLRRHAAIERGLAEELVRLRGVVAGGAAATPADRAWVLCELDVLAAIQSGSLDPLRACAEVADALPPDHVAVLEIEALLAMGDAMPREARIEGLLARAGDARASIAALALAALAEVEDPRVNERLRAALERSDVGVVAAAAGAIAARSVDADKRDPGVGPALERALVQFGNDDAIEVRIAAIEALGSLGRSPRPGVREGAEISDEADAPWLATTVLGLHADPAPAVRRAAREALLGHDDLLARFDAAPAAPPPTFGVGAQVLERARGVRGVLVRTTRGDLTIDFSGAPAPMNQANLVELARAGYFDQIRWHRVVPGFVVQGGDPRGDGYGGPGYLVPCEWSALRFERGTVGVALAGKDTGGSQFFVTLARQPHLDARYTVIGQVTSGMEVVDRLTPHDRILGVTALESIP
jgi:cyclophilin family peptidyl-prolyl cis-trans isomerase